MVILAIDPGATSGWCVLVPEAQSRAPRVEAGVAKTTPQREACVQLAVTTAAKRERALVVVAETWRVPAPKPGEARPGEKRRPFGAQTAAGLGANWGRWLAELERAAIRASSIIRVDTGTWRARVLGYPKRRPTEAWKRAALARASTVTSAELAHDAAEAVCIALWAQIAGEVGLALPAATLRAALARPEDADLLAELERRRGLAPTTTRPR